MKTTAPVFLLRMILLAACLGLLARAARAQINQLDVGVRSTVVDKPLAKPFDKSNPLPAPEHGKIYSILSVSIIPEEKKTVKPVDAYKLLDLVRHELDTQGFHQVENGLKPQILLTVQYGRAWLNNPYYGDAQALETGVDAMPLRTITMATATPARQTEASFELKAQKAEYEKLCIKLTAWQYPADPKARAKQLWTTIMVVDDPDHRDLNAIAAEMLAAGAPYFDKEIKDPEVDVYKPLPEGHVNVGTPEVVELAASKSK
jgi:hypothetical protein